MPQGVGLGPVLQ